MKKSDKSDAIVTCAIIHFCYVITMFPAYIHKEL